MRVTAIEEYGLRCMILLARNQELSLTLPEISAREGLSLPYAGKLLMILKRSGLVRAARGRKGVYLLAKPAQNIMLKEVFGALGEPVFSPSHCEKYAGDSECCIHVDDCTVKNIWGVFNEFVNGYVGRTTLADLASGRNQIKELSGSENNLEKSN